MCDEVIVCFVFVWICGVLVRFDVVVWGLCCFLCEFVFDVMCYE